MLVRSRIKGNRTRRSAHSTICANDPVDVVRLKVAQEIAKDFWGRFGGQYTSFRPYPVRRWNGERPDVCSHVHEYPIQRQVSEDKIKRLRFIHTVNGEVKSDRFTEVRDFITETKTVGDETRRRLKVLLQEQPSQPRFAGEPRPDKAEKAQGGGHASLNWPRSLIWARTFTNCRS